MLINDIIGIVMVLLVALLCNTLWKVEVRSGKILLTLVMVGTLLIAIWIAQAGLNEHIDSTVSWIAILAATLLLKWLHTVIKKTDRN